jgi:hypothetical protein
MKIILTERQYKLLNEETVGLDDFINFLIDSHPNVDNFKDIVRKFIEDSGCQNIEIKKIHLGAAGLALHDKVVINPMVFNHDLNYTMYVIFHEIAHQYQYKKYGRDKMYSLYLDELPIDEAIPFLRKTENVADQFAIRKCRELYKLGLLDRVGLVDRGMYDVIPDFTLIRMVQHFRKNLKDNNVTNPDRVSEIMYNSIVNGISNNEQELSEGKDKTITCKCGWKWKLSDGEDDPYTCHKCGHVNKEQDIDERSRSFAFTRKKRLFSKPERMSNPLRYKLADRLKEENEKTNERKILNFFDLVSKRIVWITEPHTNGERVEPNWEHDTNVITLWNVEHPESGQEWVRQAIHFPKNNSVKWWNEVGQFQLTDDKYNQIVRSIELYKKQNEKDKDAKFLTCMNCRKKFTQTTHKGKKSLPICPTCGTHNK